MSLESSKLNLESREPQLAKYVQPPSTADEYFLSGSKSCFLALRADCDFFLPPDSSGTVVSRPLHKLMDVLLS